MDLWWAKVSTGEWLMPLTQQEKDMHIETRVIQGEECVASLRTDSITYTGAVIHADVASPWQTTIDTTTFVNQMNVTERVLQSLQERLDQLTAEVAALREERNGQINYVHS